MFSSSVIVVSHSLSLSLSLSLFGGYSLFIVARLRIRIILVIDLRLFSRNYEINKASLVDVDDGVFSIFLIR